MKLTLRIAGSVLLFMGTIWIFQGIGLLPGSFMSGQPKWAGLGAIADVIGIGLFIVASRR
jgi:hypothetical protein